jgi:hypothetical protein
MILSFQEQFVPLILSKSKCTTIRKDTSKRWRPGLEIQFWKGNPRNIHQNPYQFGLATCSFVRLIRVVSSKEEIYFDNKWWNMENDSLDILRFVVGDGFATTKEFFQFFLDTYGDDYFEGVLIGWHNFIPIKKGGQP